MTPSRTPRIFVAYEKRRHGGPLPTWRPVPPEVWRGYGDALQRAYRRVSRKRAKRIVFGGRSIKAY